MGRKLLIVESGKKSQTLAKFLGSDWIIRTSFGHVCDLPRKEYGVDKATFDEVYVQADDRQKKVIADLKRAAKGVDHVYLGTDPDREGEAIAWHLVRLLGLKKGQYSRVEWNSITKPLVEKALQNPRDLDNHRVEAQRSRRVLDRIVGYDISSEICWPAGANAAGRVQTPALHILCEREREIQNFVAEDYFTLSVTYNEGFQAFVPEEITEEVTDDEGNVTKKTRIRSKRYVSEAEAQADQSEAEANSHRVESVERKKSQRSPNAAYDTATLQKDADTKLRLSPKQTMDLAQALYEDGKITYMRTDSTRISDEGIELAREHIARNNPEALSETPNRGRAGDQDGHEAIRPTSLDVSPSDLPKGSEKLYAMIVARFLASQCKPAVFDRTNIRIRSGTVEWLSQGSVLVDPGFLVYWGPYARTEDEMLPDVADGQELSPDEFAVEKKRTSPPPRYSQADLVMKMKASGIGRPATYAATLETLKRHNYVEIQKSGRKKELLVPTAHGMLLDGLMTATVPELVTEQYTADMEATLDRIERGDETRIGYLKNWYSAFESALQAAQPRAALYRKEHNLRPKSRGGGGEETNITCDSCGEATYVKLERKNKKGKFLKCSNETCGFMRDVRAKTRPCTADGCSGKLVERKRRDGKGSFMACTQCKHIENVDGSSSGSGLYAREGTEKNCPRCEKHKLFLFKLRKPVDGKNDFYGCPDRNECKFTLEFGARAHRVPCDKCGGLMVERASRKGDKFWGCAKCPHTRALAISTSK